MKLVIQRVSSASVTIDGKLHSSIGKGLLVLIGVHSEDDDSEIEYLTKKLTQLRIFNDENDKMNLSLNDIGGEILLVSQFTLYAQCDKGHRPSFMQAARPEKANLLYEEFIEHCRNLIGASRVQTGVFGADMKVALVNDGPVTIIL